MTPFWQYISYVMAATISWMCCIIFSFFIYFIYAQTSDPIFFNYRRVEHFKVILRISKVFGSRGGATEIRVTKYQFLAMSENLTNYHAYCSFKLIFNNEWLIFIHSLDFLLIIITGTNWNNEFNLKELGPRTAKLLLFKIMKYWLSNFLLHDN